MLTRSVENGLACAYLALLLLGTLGNLTILSAAVRRAEIRSRTNFCLAQLALADLLTLIYCVPLEMGQLLRLGPPAAWLCCGIDYLQQTLAMFTICMLALIAYANISAQSDPLRYMEQISARRALSQLAAGLAMLAGCLYVALPVLATGPVNSSMNDDDANNYEQSTLGCSRQEPRLDVGYHQVALLVCILMAQLIIYLLLKSKEICWPKNRQVVVATCQRWAAAEAGERQRNNWTDAAAQQAHVATHDDLMAVWRGLALNELKMIFLVTVAHSLCWTPLIVGNFIVALNRVEHVPRSTNYGLVNPILHLLAYTSSAVKPIIYTCMSPDFSHYLKRLLRSNLCRV